VKRALLAALLVSALAAPARAVLLDLDASDLGGNALDFEVLDGGVLAIDPDFVNATPMRIVLVPEAGDPTVLAWNALVDNLTGELWVAFSIEATHATVGAGSVAANASGVAGVDALPGAGLRIRFQLPGEPAGFDLGAPFGAGSDWTLEHHGAFPFELLLSPIPVPEPASLALLVSGVGLLAASRRL
jgi:hypothetical protein